MKLEGQKHYCQCSKPTTFFTMKHAICTANYSVLHLLNGVAFLTTSEHRKWAKIKKHHQYWRICKQRLNQNLSLLHFMQQSWCITNVGQQHKLRVLITADAYNHDGVKHITQGTRMSPTLDARAVECEWF